MRCISPLKASFNSQGDMVYSSKNAEPGLVPIEFECRRCLPCRLNLAREKAIRCMHEARESNGSMFLTLTYSDDHLESPRLNYRDFQLFMKRLRFHYPEQKINYMVTGEYGEETKRPHWHAIIFNFYPEDAEFYYTSDRGDKLFKSKAIDEIWGKNDPDTRPNEFGEVTIDSANYVARYAAKKLVHGKDEEHDYHPIHKTSSRYGLGRKWIEKYWKQTFSNGYVTLPNGSTSKIPRYYVDWFKKNYPVEYQTYIRGVREDIMQVAETNARKEELIEITNMMNYKGGAGYPLPRNSVKERVLQSKFKKLQEFNKL